MQIKVEVIDFRGLCYLCVLELLVIPRENINVAPRLCYQDLPLNWT